MSKLTVVVWNNQKAYFFRGTQYVRYDIDADKPDEGYPRTIDSGWPGLFKQDIDAAVVWPNGTAYFFSGSQYTRYDVAADRAEQDYPKSISSGWPGVFEDGIDAAVVWPNGKAYFFRGSEYTRYDIENDRADDGYPQPISDQWSGVFDRDLGGVGLWPNGKAYFFKGDSYQRYDVENDSVDAGYPASIGGWGLPFGQATAATGADSEFRKRCTALLSKHEGHERHVYPDSLKIPSIGIGFNLKRSGARNALAAVGADYDQVLAGKQDLTDAQIDALFVKDLDGAIAGAKRQVPNFDQLPFNARLVVVDMMFMGEGAFAGFKKMIAALKAFDYDTAADEMKDSKWYGQVGLRGPDDEALMRSAANQ